MTESQIVAVLDKFKAENKWLRLVYVGNRHGLAIFAYYPFRTWFPREFSLHPDNVSAENILRRVDQIDRKRGIP